MAFFFGTRDGVCGDFIPFFDEGVFHLFYLKDFRDPARCGEGTPWCKAVTEDFVRFTDQGEMLPRGSAREQDLFVFTGSAIKAMGRYHIFYTGHNPHLRAQGLPEEAVMHAVSDDATHWTKIPGDTFFAPDDPAYEKNDWRDPLVYFDGDDGLYHMLLAARRSSGQSRRRGVTAHCVSKDLKTWTPCPPVWAPGLYFAHECPDMFRMGAWHYLLFSEFSQGNVTRYVMSRSPRGPWIAPPDDQLDGRAYYAAKTASDGDERYLFGWLPTREGETDHGAWQWGGVLAVHRLLQNADGTLRCVEPDDVKNAFSRTLSAPGDTRLDAGTGFACEMLGEMPDTCRIEAAFRTDTTWAQAFGICLRADETGENGYFLRVEPSKNRVVFDTWPRPGDQAHMQGLERPLSLAPGAKVSVAVIADGTAGVAYINGEKALSFRMYDRRAGAWGVFARQADTRVTDMALRVQPEA